MNKIYRIVVLAIISITLMMGVSSCVADRNHFLDDEQEIEVDICAELTNFSSHQLLRASAEASIENNVKNLYLMVFAKDGSLVHRDAVMIADSEAVMNPGDKKQLPKKPYLFKNATYTFALIANYGADMTIYGVEETALAQIQSLSDLKAFKFTLKRPTFQRSEPAFLMTGLLEARVTDLAEIVVPLKRVDAKVKFVISTDEGIDNTTVSFTPKEWYIRNVPKSATPDPSDNNVGLTGDNNYYYPGKESANRSPLFLMEEGGKEFTFYMPPNSKKTMEGKDCKTFKKRELQEKSIDNQATGTYHLNQGAFGDKFVENGDFVYADPYATYIEIVGDFHKENKTDKSGVIAGKMHYIIHLGYVNQKANNWEADSNGSYTYYIKINGVGEVETEVIRDNEDNTAVTGHVLEYKKLELRDAPFGYGMITFTPEELSMLRDVNNMSYLVQTPFCDNALREGKDFDTPKPAGLDNDWIRFRFHRSGDPTNTILPFDSNNRGLTLEAFLKELSNYKNYTTDVTVTYYLEENYYKTKPANSNFSGDWERDGWRTFVNQPDRYIGLFIYDGTEAGHKISRDQESQYTKADILFRQKSIVTHYSLNETVFPNGNSAFGIQAIQDPYSEYTFKKVPKSSGGYDKDYFQKSVANGPNAYYYTLLGRELRGNNSSDHMKYSTIRKLGAKGYEVTAENLNGRYVEHKAYLECMKYNRDENGNGIIDLEEMVWYLPAMYQYMTLGIGVYSLPNDNPLYPQAYPYNDFQHYVSSTRAGQQSNNAMIYHAELLYNATEALYDPISWPHPGTWGAGEVTYNFWKYISYVKPYAQSGKYASGNMYYRCARKLGKSEIIQEGRDKVIELETSLFKREEVGNSYKITCYLEEKSIRPASMKVERGPLPKHNERSIFNRPTRTFYVYKKTISNKRKNNGDYTDLGWTPYKEGETACQTLGPEWRLPSASELSIMLMALDERDPEYHTLRQLPGEFGWEQFIGDRRYNRQEKTATSQLGDETSRIIYWSSTGFSSNPIDEPDRYVYGLMGGWNHPVLSLVRPHVRENLGGKFGAQGYIRCVHDGD